MSITRHTRIAFVTAALIILAAIALVLAGCGAATPSGAVSQPEPANSPASTGVTALPTIRIVAPVDGDAVGGGEVRVEVETTGLTFAMPSNTIVPGEGHVHFTLDDEPFKMSTTPDYTFENVAPGEHTLEAELVQNDTTSFSPPVVQTVTFTVE